MKSLQVYRLDIFPFNETCTCTVMGLDIKLSYWFYCDRLMRKFQKVVFYSIATALSLELMLC